jgi:hypothetical protein
MAPSYNDPIFGTRDIGRISDEFPFHSPRNPSEAKGFQWFRDNNALRIAVAFTKGIEKAIEDYDHGKRSESTIHPPPGYSTLEISNRFQISWATEGDEGTANSYWKLCCILTNERRQPDEWDQDLGASVKDWEKTQAEKTADGSESGTDDTNKDGRRRARWAEIGSTRRRILESLREREHALSRAEEELSKDKERFRRDKKRLRRKKKRLSKLEERLKGEGREMRVNKASWRSRWSQLGLERTDIGSDGEEGSDRSEESTVMADTILGEEE